MYVVIGLLVLSFAIRLGTDWVPYDDRVTSAPFYYLCHNKGCGISSSLRPNICSGLPDTENKKVRLAFGLKYNSPVPI